MLQSLVGSKYIRKFDAFSKISPDAQIRTSSGGLITVLSFALITVLVFAEFISYRTVIVQPELVVDKTRAERMNIHLNISFPRVPCSLLSLDVMDVSGEVQHDVSHTITKTRRSAEGVVLSEEVIQQLGNANAYTPPKDYCGPCYGADPPEGEKCCNTCEIVREAYLHKGWAIDDHDAIEQCKMEHYKDQLEVQAHEGCTVSGYLEVNKVIGNFHFAPGRSFQGQGGAHVHDTSTFFGGKYDFSHTIHSLRFGNAIEQARGVQNNPLDGTVKTTSHQNYNYLYFVKCVSTTYMYLSSALQPASTNQYSATSHERPIEGGADPEHAHAVHSRGGIPGVFFSYDISPMRVIQREARQGTFGEFVSATVGIVGGVLVIAQVLDRLIFEGNKAYQRKVANGKAL